MKSQKIEFGKIERASISRRPVSVRILKPEATEYLFPILDHFVDLIENQYAHDEKYQCPAWVMLHGKDCNTDHNGTETNLESQWFHDKTPLGTIL